MSGIEDLLTLAPDVRRHVLAKLNQEERRILLEQIDFRVANPYLKYQNRPVEFVQEVLKETVWSKQIEILESMRDNQRTAVHACHAPGKTHIAARAVAYWASVWPPGTSKIVTTSTTFRQVKNVLWPHIRRLQYNHGLPGYTNTVEWMMGTPPEAMAEGVKPADDDEAAMNGYHAPNLLILVDEAGGISSTFGRSMEALMTGGNTRLLVVGNPPVDEEGTWFERICSSPQYNTIRIAASDTPAWTGEDTGRCKSCPPGVEPHDVVLHLVDHKWVNTLKEEFGEDSPFYQARVDANFPRDNTQKTIPISWLENAQKNTYTPQLAVDTIQLGVDVASDGGDEMVIAELDGWRARILHSQSGGDNEDATHVASVILRHIQDAEKKHGERGIDTPVRVKVDAIGVGWAIVSLLTKWGKEGKHHAKIVGVNVAQKARDSKKFVNQRAEMWWYGRTQVAPKDGEQATELWLDVDMKVMKQLNGPMYGADSGGRILIEKKDKMKRRGQGSPDRAEALLLAMFEPGGQKHEAPAPISLPQVNEWADSFAQWNN